MNAAVYPSLKDRVVLVTGGGSGIGASIVEHFCRQGAKVSFIDFDRHASETLVGELSSKNLPRPRFYFCDLRHTEDLKSVITEVIRVDGPIRTLVNNAARDDRHAIDDVTPEYFDERIATNLKHYFFAIQAVYPKMAEAGGGTIINMGSVSWMMGLGGMHIYTTSKAAIAGLTRSMARDLGPMNIRVNSILPGAILTKRQEELWRTEEGNQSILEHQCLKRLLVPEEIARMVLFFAADDSSACTQQNYVADGGWV